MKQRLSRGRKLLHEQVLAFVEGALGRTNPGQAFTLAVLAALPATVASSAKAAMVAAAAKGGAVAKGTVLGSVLGLPLVHCRGGKLPGQKTEPAVGWIAFGEIAYGILFANGAVAVGAVSIGGASVGIVSFGGFSLGLLTFGGLAMGGLALGGAAVGFIASGGVALAWHAAIGGVAAAHELALGGTAMANHANDSVARDFFTSYRWLDFTQGAPRILFFAVCFAPVFLQLLAWNWWRRKMLKRATRN